MSVAIDYEKKVHVFDSKGNVEIIKGESLEGLFRGFDLDNFELDIDNRDRNEFKTVLSKDFWLNIFDNCKYSAGMIIRNQDVICNNIEIVISHIEKNKVLYKRVVFMVALLFMFSANPSMALTVSAPVAKLKKFVLDLVSFILHGVLYGTIGVTMLRLFSEYTKGGSKYKYIEVFRVGILICALILLLPLVPKFLNFLINTYLLEL